MECAPERTPPGYTALGRHKLCPNLWRPAVVVRERVPACSGINFLRPAAAAVAVTTNDIAIATAVQRASGIGKRLWFWAVVIVLVPIVAAAPNVELCFTG